jgi:hypothetical protein
VSHWCSALSVFFKSSCRPTAKLSRRHIGLPSSPSLWTPSTSLLEWCSLHCIWTNSDLSISQPQVDTVSIHFYTVSVEAEQKNL